MSTTNKAVVLVIDDEQTYLDVITQTLKERNYRIMQALDGNMGYMVAQKFMPDIIITDWEMPEMNGIDTICKLKQNEQTKDIPVIMCTGIMTSAQNLDRALNAGAVDFIRKPIEPIELISRINSALNMANAFKELKSSNQQIIEQKRDIELKNEELVALNATKDKFFSIIAHDLKNPFISIMGFCELLINNSDRFDKERILEYVGHLNEISTKTYKLLDNLLNWSRIQTGRMIPVIKDYNLKNIIRGVCSLNQELASKKNIMLQNKVVTDMIVSCDDDMTKTALRNLVSNAIKFTPSGGSITVDAYRNIRHIEIHVKDTGVGISEDKLPKLFQIDQHVSTSGTNDEMGTGLGLLLCKELIEMQNGKIWVESEVGKGSDFKFTLPIINHEEE